MSIIYQEITQENFRTVSLKQFKMCLMTREDTLNTDFSLSKQFCSEKFLFNIVYIFPVFSGCILIKWEINMDCHYTLAKTTNRMDNCKI